MKVLHIPFHYFPEAVGGTEVYVSSLAKRLQEQGIDVEIAAPAESNEEYFHDGIQVRRFGITKDPEDLATLYGKGDPEATRQFASVLERSQPDVVHLHAMSPAVSIHVVNESKKLGIPVVFTCHIPGITCPRGTLLRNGTQACDGVWELRRCTACNLQAKGLSKGLAAVFSFFPQSLGRSLGAGGFRGSAITALRMPALQADRQQSLMKFFGGVDRIVAVSGWLRDLLLANDLPSNKVMLCRHGSSQASSLPYPVGLTKRRDGILRIAFLGRVNPAKGVHVLVEAIRKRPQIPVQLDIFGIIQDDDGYVENLRRRIGNDSRIRLLSPLPNASVIETLRNYDALAVPSQWLETGPLVVYDAFLAGIPVIGSRRGGIAELVTDEQDGLLVEPDDSEAWADAIERLCTTTGLQEKLRAGVRVPRSMSVVAREMADLYVEVVHAAGTDSSAELALRS